MPTTSDLLESLARSRASLLASHAGLTEEQLARKGTVGEWSIKDMLGHVAAWERMMLGFLPRRVATGATPAVLLVLREHGEDAVNAVEVAERESLTPQEQLAELQQARARLAAYIGTLGDAALEGTHPWPEWEGTLAAYLSENLSEHELEHEATLRAAAERLRAE